MGNELVELSVVEWVTEAHRLVKTDDPAEIRRLEALLECSQAEAVSHFVEDSCCSDDLPDFAGGKGTPQDRRSALLALWKDYEGTKHHA